VAEGDEAALEEEEAEGPGLVTKLVKSYRTVYDSIFYGDTLPVIGNNHISYAKLLELLHDRAVKRIYLYADGRYAVVELPCEGWNIEMVEGEEALRFSKATTPYFIEYNTKENPEWRMEKLRFWCEIPGDAYADGLFMKLVKSAMQVHRLESDRVPIQNQVPGAGTELELQVMDPTSQFVWGAEYAPQILPIVGLISLRALAQGGDWVLTKLGWGKKKDARSAMAEQMGKHTAQEFNVEKGGILKGKTKKTVGVTFDDIAGIDPVKDDLNEILAMIMGDEKFQAMGVAPPRGILLEGPPGTGKTLLAKAMAGEKGIPFYSANGAEFVEMFQGVAAARIRSLFASARKNSDKGAIIFIDEIDAIGKARGSAIMDPGSQEREQGLLQLLVEMDGFTNTDKVLVVAATNRVDVLDDALLRPGRFDRMLYMGRPTTSNRQAILRVHSRGKAVGSDAPGAETGDELLARMAQLTPGFSGAELANLMNEAAIVSVRQKKDAIDYETMMTALEKIRLGLAGTKLLDSPAKERLAYLLAARAVAFAVNPCTPPIEQISILPRGRTISRITYVPLEAGLTGGEWHLLAYRDTRGYNQTLRDAAAVKANPPLGSFAFLAKLLVPLLVGRASEEVLWGKEGVTLSTSDECASAAQLAYYLVSTSQMDPQTVDSPVMFDMEYSGVPDPLTKRSGSYFEKRVAALHEAAHAEAVRLVEDFRPAIEAVAKELLASESETVQGTRLLQVLRETCGDQVERLREEGEAGADTVLEGASEAYVRVSGAMMDMWGEPVTGWQDFKHRHGGASLPEVLFGDDAEARARLEGVRKFATDAEAPFPDEPRQPEDPDDVARASVSELKERLLPAESVKL